MKVATYSRISTDEERQPFSLEAQADRLKAHIESQDWSFVGAYTDQMSGKTLNRPGLAQALADGRDGRYELLLVFKVDRLARSTSALVSVLEQLDRSGVAFRSVSEPFDTSTAAGRMMIQMLGVFAEFEREMIVERTKLGLAKKASKGQWTGGVAPFGYRYEKERGVLVPVAPEAHAVGLIFDRYVNRRWGSAKISHWLNERAQTTRRGGRWTPKTVLDVLRNPTYLGKLPFNGQIFDAGHEPIVKSEFFNLAQALLKERGEDYPRRSSVGTPYLLTSLLRCSRCGHGFIGTSATGKNGRYRYYTCYCRQRGGTSRCDQQRIPADALEDAILAATLAALSGGDVFMQAAENASESWNAAHPSREADLRHFEAEITAKRNAIDRYLRAFERERLSQKSCGYRIKELESEIGVLETQKALLAAEQEQAPPTPSLVDLRQLTELISKAINDAEPEQIKKLLAGIIDEIVVESRACIQPYFVWPGVRMVERSRRRTGIEPAHRFITGALVLKTRRATRPQSPPPAG